MQITNNPLQQILYNKRIEEIKNTQKSLNLLEQVLYQKWGSTVMCLNGCNNIYFIFKGKEIRFDEDYERKNIFINSDILPDDYQREAINMINTLNLAKSNYKEKLQLLITQIKKMPQIIYKIDFIKKAKEYKKKYDNIEEAIKDAEVSIRNHLQYAKKRRKEMYLNNNVFCNFNNNQYDHYIRPKLKLKPIKLQNIANKVPNPFDGIQNNPYKKNNNLPKINCCEFNVYSNNNSYLRNNNF